MTTKISGTGFDSLTIDELVLTTPLAEQYGGSGSTGVYKMGYATPKSATGTFVDFTGIPSWAKRVTVMFSSVSTNGTTSVIIQLGDSGGIEATGYFSVGSAIQNGVTGASDYTTGFGLGNDNGVAYSVSGTIQINNLYGIGNLHVVSGMVRQQSLRTTFVSGEKTLSATLDKIRITTVNGTDTFDAGTINVMWEGFA